MLETSEDTTASGKGVQFYTLLSSVNFPFRPASAGHVYACPGYYVKRSKRSEAYILYTLSGKGEMTWKGETVSLTPGSVCIIHCEEYHYYKTTSTDCPWEYYYVHFTGSGLDAYSGYLLDKPRCLFPKDPESFLQKMKYLTAGAIDSNPPLLDSKCSKILAELMDALLEVSTLTAPIAVPSNTSSYTALEQAYRYISLNYANPIRLEDLADACSLSKYYFSHLFKENCGVTPYQYLTTYRINNAKRLLADNSLSISKISAMVGFPNYTNFLAQFKKQTGLYPQEYRKCFVF